MAKTVGIHWVGLGEFQNEITKWPKTVKQVAGRAMFKAAHNPIMRASQDAVPVDLGTLRDSGFVDQPDIDAHSVSVRMGYGGAAKAYALAVHENPSQHDPPSWGGRKVVPRPGGQGGPKYLERPFREHQDDVTRLVAKAIRKALT